MDELTIGDKIYISSKRAAAITGYAKDYVGQLCREGHVEAKMVGRSWYVLESSIRAHRFGQVEEIESSHETRAGEIDAAGARDGGAPATAQEVPRSFLPDTWEASKYVAEEAPVMPALMPEARIPEPYETAQSLDMSDERESLSEMQAAWKDWFEAKREVVEEAEEDSVPELVEEPIKEEEPEEEDAVPVAVHRIEPVRPATPVKMDIHPVQAPAAPPRPAYLAPMPTAQQKEAPAARHKKPAKKRARGESNLVMIALLIALAGMVIAVSYIGAGFGGQYVGSNPVIDYLGGTSSIQK